MGSTQRGAIIAENENGTLERVDGSSTYIGSMTLDGGKVVTKRFRSHARDDSEVTERWLKWQCRQDRMEEELEKEAKKETEKEAAMAESINPKEQKCPFSGCACGPQCPVYSTENRKCSVMLLGIGMYNMSVNFLKLDPNESLELVAMAIADSKPAASKVPAMAAGKTAADGIGAYLSGKTFLDFVNLHAKAAYTPYKRFCESGGYPMKSQAEFTKDVVARFAEIKAIPKHGGSVFAAA